MNLKTKMLSLLLIPVFILIGALSYYAYASTKGMLEEQIRFAGEYRTGFYGEQINGTLGRQEAIVNDLVALFAARDVVPGEYATIVKTAKNSNADVLNVLVAFENKIYVDSDGWMPPSDYDPRSMQWYKQSMDHPEQITYSDVYTEKKSGNLMVTMGRPILSGGKTIGIAAIDVNLSRLLENVKQIKIGELGYAFVMNREGAMISHPEYTMQDTLPTIKGGVFKDLYEKITSQKSISHSVSLDGEERLYASAPIGTTGWYLITSSAASELFAQVSAMAKVFVAAGIVVVLLLGSIILWLTLNITNDLKKMQLKSEQFAEGNFRSTQSEMHRSDEIGRLAAAFGGMGERLKSLIKQVAGSAEQLAASSEELTASAEQSAQVSSQVAVSITEVASGAQAQLETVDKTVRIVNGMAQKISLLAQSAKSVGEQAEKTVQKTTLGNAIVEKAVWQMRQIEEAVGASADAIQTLGTQSRKIDEIVETISSIAGQTNLLALNAAIEAARAGENGKGFAVVAEEVRKLAEQSRVSAGHISSLVAEIRQNTDAAAIAMEKGSREVTEGANAVGEAGRTFEEINDMISLVNQRVFEAQNCMVEIVSGNDEIAKAVGSIDQICKETADQSNTVSAATEEQLASMEEIASASRALATLAQELQNAIGKFKV